MARSSGSSRKSPPSVEPGFVGRRSEVEELRIALDETFEGRARLFLVAGEAGIGKTRLAEEIARQAEARGARSTWGRCWHGGGSPPFWPWVQVIRS
ncbi:MAG: AAA family ATPase, partial [Candidatus Binatia bacterium]